MSHTETWSWDSTSLTLGQKTITTDDVASVPDLERGDLVYLALCAKVGPITQAPREDDTIDRAQRSAVARVAIVDRVDVEDLLTASEARTGTPQLPLSSGAQRRAAMRLIIEASDELAAEQWTPAKIDGAGLRDLLARARSPLDQIDDRPDPNDESSVHPFHWSDPAEIETDLLDELETDLVKAGRWVLFALEWVARQQGRRHEALAKRTSAQEVDGVVLTEAEADDLAAPPPGADAPVVADSFGELVEQVLGAITESPGMKGGEIADRLEVSIGRVRNATKTLATTGEIVEQKDGNAIRWYPADEAPPALELDDKVAAPDPDPAA